MDVSDTRYDRVDHSRVNTTLDLTVLVPMFILRLQQFFKQKAKWVGTCPYAQPCLKGHGHVLDHVPYWKFSTKTSKMGHGHTNHKQGVFMGSYLDAVNNMRLVTNYVPHWNSLNNFFLGLLFPLSGHVQQHRYVADPVPH